MAMTMQMPKKVQGAGGAWLDKPGVYHCTISDVQENATDKDQKPLNGFKVQLSVLDGTVRDSVGCTERNKTFDLILFHPDPTKSESSQEWSLRKQAAFIIGAGLVTEKQLGEAVSFDLNAAKDRQVIVALNRSDRSTDTKTFLELAYADIFHIDDPRTEKFPKDAAAIRLLPPHMRRDPKSFDLVALTGKADAVADGGGDGGGTANTANGAAGSNGGGAASGAAAGGVNIDDL